MVGLVPIAINHPIALDLRGLAATPLEALSCITSALRVQPDPVDAPALPTAKLADDISKDWALRFRDEYPTLVTSDMSAAF